MNVVEGIAKKPSTDSVPPIAAPERSGVRATAVLDPEVEESGIRPSVRSAARIRFERSSPHCVLTVEAAASEDLMPQLYRLLVSTQVQVIRVHAQVLGDRTLHELDVVEFDGSPLVEERWRYVQVTTIDHLGDRVVPMGPELRFTRSRRPSCVPVPSSP